MNLPLRYLYDDHRLRERALVELARALRNDRLIALTGSMSDEALGYFSWKGFKVRLGQIATTVAVSYAPCRSDPVAEALLGAVEKHAELLRKGEGAAMEPTVRFGVIRDCFAQLSLLPVVKQGLEEKWLPAETPEGEGDKEEEADPIVGDRSPIVDFNALVAGLFTKRRPGAPRAAAIRPLLESLGVSRIATLNYDFELERALMLRRDEREKSPRFLDFVGGARSGRAIVRDRIGRLRRVMGDGLTVESDIVDRERPDRLLEFAIGSAEVDRHILHLHGRADSAASMVVTASDYDLRYRRDDLFRNPFEHGMRVLLAGNPVLFVGLGMTEKEINDFLRYFVSNTPYRRMAPAFLIWNTLDEEQNGEWVKRSGAPLEEFMESRRLDFLQRLGVHVIFDEDLVAAGVHGESWVENLRRRHREETDPAKKEAIALTALPETLRRLPEVVAEIKAAAARTGNEWRSLPRLRRIDPAGGEQVDSPTEGEAPGPARLWGSPELQQSAAKANSDRPQDLSTRHKLPRGYETILVGTAEPGAGRGVLSERIVQLKEENDFTLPGWRVRGTQRRDRLLINAGFSYDSDAMLNAIALFLRSRLRPAARGGDLCREQRFADASLFKVKVPALVIINGIDRFFGFDGQPLSAELDHLLRCVRASGRDPEVRVQWLLLGTERIRSYFDNLRIDVAKLTRPLVEESSVRVPSLAGVTTLADKSLLPEVDVGSRYLDWVGCQFNGRARARYRDLLVRERKSGVARRARPPRLTEAAQARIREAVSTDRDSVRRAFFGGYLAPPLLQSLDFSCPATFEVLRTMAFIGSPVEAAVLLHAPKIVAILDECMPEDLKATEGPKREAFLKKVIDDLKLFGLILPIAPDLETLDKEDSWLWHRYGLHRSLASELRERHGAPISEAKLSTTFNMSLFVAQPGDTHMPKESFHDELGELVDRLAGGWKDLVEAVGTDGCPVDEELFHGCQEAATLIFRPKDRRSAYFAFRALSLRRSSACLRAALAVVRGYYSTSSLLTLGRDSRLVSETRVGALSEHAERLDRLLKTFGKIATARKIFREAMEKREPNKRKRAEILGKWLGPEPFYADDLVWLHNERGVAKLAQGHLYDARRSFSLAFDANSRNLEFGHRGHNWRRITTNLVGLLIERGRLNRAERRIDEIEASVDLARWRTLAKEDDQAAATAGRRAGHRPPFDRVRLIRETFGREDSPTPIFGTLDFTREEILVVALATSYRALIAHMRGQYRDADPLYRIGTTMLRHLKETRAYSIFQRHFATLGRRLVTRLQARQEVELAIAAADAVKQLDISHRARIVRAAQVRSDPASDAESRRMALQQLHRALDYAAMTDAYRVRIEASSSLAKQMRESGDYDTALRYASDALAIACRYGHSLHKISLRVEIGRILIQRGDPQSGDALFQSALETAMRSGYHRTVERVQSARQIEHGPKSPRTEDPV